MFQKLNSKRQEELRCRYIGIERKFKQDGLSVEIQNSHPVHINFIRKLCTSFLVISFLQQLQ